MSRSVDMTDIHLTQLFRVLQNVGELFLEKLRLLVGQVDPREFGDVGDVEIGCFGHRSRMQTIEQPNGRYQKRNDQEEKNDAAFAALFPKRTASLARSSVAVAFVVQRHRNVEATAALARAHEQFFALTSLHLFATSGASGIIRFSLCILSGQLEFLSRHSR